MTKRKKKIILLQSGIFLIAIALIFATYYDKDKKTVTNSKINESAQLSENKKDAEKLNDIAKLIKTTKSVVLYRP